MDTEGKEEDIMNILKEHAEKLVVESNRQVDKSMRFDFL